MDLRAGRLPQPQQSSTTTSTSSSSSNNPFNGTETIRTNEPNKFITFKDVYDYLSLDILSGAGSASGSVSDADLLYPFGLTNYTLDGIGGGGGGGGASTALNQSTTLFQSSGGSNGTAAWNSSALWLANGSLLAAAATTASIGLGGGAGGISNGNGLLEGDGEEAELGSIIVTAATSIILGLMILITVIGNVFVIAAIILERNLQNVANYLVASLAVADLFVACLVMPLGALYEICGWILGPDLCDIWTSCDVLCCTASILHLVAIATDRYWVVTDVDYIHSRTSRRVFTMIFLVWFAAVVVSLAPQFGWKDPDYLRRIEQEKCMVSQDVAYQVFATCSTFYVPLLVILVLYWKIYQTARRRINRRRHHHHEKKQPREKGKAAGKDGGGAGAGAEKGATEEPPQKPKTAAANTGSSKIPFRLARLTAQGRSTLRLVKGTSTNTVNTVEDTELSSNERKCIEVTSFYTSTDENPTSSAPQITTVSSHVIGEIDDDQNDETTAINSKADDSPTDASVTSVCVPKSTPHQICNLVNQVQLSMVSHVSPGAQKAQHKTTTNSNPHAQVTRRKETLKAKRERKAAKTLAIITGAFVICWLPFFIMALVMALCTDCVISDTIISFFLWLGYFNSTLNPVIYTVFSPEFRQAFKRILCGTRRNAYHRSGKF